jgi:hypothetical protein
VLGHRLGAAQADEFRQRVGGERLLAREQFVEDEPERVHVALDGQLPARELLGRHVLGRALDGVLAAELLGESGQPEVHHADVAGVVDHDVRGLEVAVQNARVVRGGEAGANLPGDLDGLVFGQPAESLEHRRQLFTLHVLHRDEVQALGLADVVNAADVAVRYLARDPHLAVEARERGAVERELLGQKLQGHGLFELEVVGAVNLAHPAAAEQSDDAVAFVEHRAGDEARVVNRGVMNREGARGARRAARRGGARRGDASRGRVSVGGGRAGAARRLVEDARLGE